MTFFEGVKEVMESLAELEPPKKRPKYDWGLQQQQWRHCCKKKFDKNLRDLYVAKFDFLPNDNIDLESPHSSRFLSDLTAISRNRAVVHHSHFSGKIIGFAHDYCNGKVRENYYTIPIRAHNQFRFDFHLLLKGLRPSVWETTDISIGGQNTTNINYAVIGSQVRFIDFIKFFQTSLDKLASNITDKRVLRKTFELLLCEQIEQVDSVEDREWVLNYLTSGKGCMPYQIVDSLDSLLKTPPEGEKYFLKKDFYSTLKERDVSEEEYQKLKKLFKVLKMKTLGDINKFYSIQDSNFVRGFWAGFCTFTAIVQVQPQEM